MRRRRARFAGLSDASLFLLLLLAMHSLSLPRTVSMKRDDEPRTTRPFCDAVMRGVTDNERVTRRVLRAESRRAMVYPCVSVPLLS